jgi:kelch-like protein 2/3
MERIAGILPLHIFAQREATKTTLRIFKDPSQRRTWDGTSHTRRRGHRRWYDNKLELCKSLLPGDIMLRANFWNIDVTPDGREDYDLIIYTDGSREGDHTGNGWFACRGNDCIYESANYLGAEATVFQAEALAIHDALLWLTEAGGPSSTLIRSDSQAAIMSIQNPETRSISIWDIKVLISKLRENDHIVHLEWVRGHNDLTGNEYADYLAKLGNGLRPMCPEPVIPESLASKKQKINAHFEKIWKTEWTNHNYKTSYLLDLSTKLHRFVKKSRRSINLIFQIVTGHSLLNHHMSHWHPELDPTCPRCLEADETTSHILEDCPALEEKRWSWREDSKIRGLYDSYITFFKSNRILLGKEDA